MIKMLPLLISLALLSPPLAGQQPSLPSFVRQVDTPWKGYVFIIPIEKRNTKKEVEQTTNWEYLGPADKITVRPGPGVKQACQLIVHELDTRLLASGVRVLKAGTRIMAEKKGDFYFVNSFISINSYPYVIHNEGDPPREAE